jgi:uncharacterized protein
MTALQQFQGFVNTPSLWQDDVIFGMEQFVLPSANFKELTQNYHPKLRLGKLVEQFVFEILQRASNCELLIENIQIQKEKISIGEIDCILKQLTKIVHLEIVFKFYLYDENKAGTDLHKWIGPNRNDDLIQKLTKLKNKQLPLLYKEETRKTLQNLSNAFKDVLNLDDLTQNVLFKAQLFVPKHLLNKTFLDINNGCVKGFYLPVSNIKELALNLFHIPDKRNWLTDPHKEVEWIDFESFTTQVSFSMSEKRSPLCWLKSPNGTMQKFFVVWW